MLTDFEFCGMVICSGTVSSSIGSSNTSSSSSWNCEILCVEVYMVRIATFKPDFHIFGLDFFHLFIVCTSLLPAAKPVELWWLEILHLTSWVRHLTSHSILHTKNTYEIQCFKIALILITTSNLRRLCLYTCLSVILFTGGLPQCMLGPDPPPAQCMLGDRPTSGRYASYRNAYLFLNNFKFIVNQIVI